MTAEATMTKPETVSIESLDEFVRALQAWHSKKVQLIQHMLTIPEGTEVSGEETATRVLEGDFREGFILGLKVALSEIGELPFEAEVELVDTAADATGAPKTIH